ncbi:hypothetical protein [Pontibacter roseus]|uniref:hypothetical protein n=1 Tax=Pontibacter roseus TaxID=336989 RepID=UPI0012FA3202|nr:hypothetical protein [Pontibacter roseus]
MVTDSSFRRNDRNERGTTGVRVGIAEHTYYSSYMAAASAKCTKWRSTVQVVSEWG